MAYGLVDINYDHESSFIKHEPGSYYFFVPQVNVHACWFDCSMRRYEHDNTTI